MKTLHEFIKTKDYLICVDSDGCAMDTMNSKHQLCFGPMLVKEWGLQRWEKEILDRWNTVNLFSMSRGINRFLGLGMLLEEIDKTYTPIEGASMFLSWVQSAQELSNATVLAKMQASGQTVFKKAYAWSIAVNTAITNLPEEVKVPFPGITEGLACAKEIANLGIISAANPEAVLQEWTQHQLMDYMDVSLAQDVGTKSYCIAKMLEFGFDPEKVVMVGDAPGDLAAARENNILYFPILVRHEAESWARFRTEMLDRLISGTYRGAYQDSLIEAFLANLS
ncbi:Haloacid dehalogenase-like hydrolase [Sphaerochaeta associata]|uniref:HAD family hydrolase n=2 Tax=Sphaerochaeta associata TaxID=1129264 RepID=A0ABY4D869_9SPIR|nr:HAD hydrolase-like protein [Sphaerochaeta associata]UOM50492.1 HAD family hydrolase [Sphaerochaeta associata]SMP40874.1 Haloacid dehalogenase-like hydrolase [Sphaerochaeta associata]